MTEIVQEVWNGWASFIVRNSFLSLRIVPQLGGKIVEIVDEKRNYQWLWQDSSRPYRARVFGDAYDAYDISGFDECFPNIGVSGHPDLEEEQLPDHGELWCQPWRMFADNGELVGEVASRLFSYLFRRIISVEANVITFSYEIHNFSSVPLPSFWSAHPLFAAHSGMVIQLTGAPSMTKEFGFSSRMGQDGTDGYGGHLDTYRWPTTEGQDSSVHDLSKIELKSPLTDKVVVQMPKHGRVRLVNSAVGCAIEFEFDPNKLPYLGICFNLGAWPFGTNPGAWVALEPSNGPTDRLIECEELGQLPTIAPNSSLKFSLSLKLMRSGGD